MSKCLVKCAVLGGIVVFLWGILSWMVFPMHKMCMNRFADEKDVASTLQNNTAMSGVYVLPNMYKDEKTSMTAEQKTASMQKAKDSLRMGPVVFAIVNKNGMDPSSPAPYIWSLIVHIIAAGVVTHLLMQAKAMSFMKQAGFVAWAGLFAAFACVFPKWVWMGLPLGFTIMQTINLVIGWFLAGLAIAKCCSKK